MRFYYFDLIFIEYLVNLMHNIAQYSVHGSASHGAAEAQVNGRLRFCSTKAKEAEDC